jgi:hypothetical protein
VLARPVLLKSIAAEKVLLQYRGLGITFGLTLASCDRLAGSDVVATNKRRYSLIPR